MATTLNPSTTQTAIKILSHSLTKEIKLKLGLASISWFLLAPGMLFFTTDFFASLVEDVGELGFTQRNILIIQVLAFIFSLIYLGFIFLSIKEVKTKKEILKQLSTSNPKIKQIIFVYNPPKPLDVGIEVGPYPALYGIAIITSSNEKAFFKLNKSEAINCYQLLKQSFKSAEFVGEEQLKKISR